jgi:hypothetical protein
MRTLTACIVGLLTAAAWVAAISGCLFLLSLSPLNPKSIPDFVWRASAITIIVIAVWVARLGYNYVFMKWRIEHGAKWTYCAAKGFCNCGLPKVCLALDCGCERLHVCAKSKCNCDRHKVCSKLKCDCGHPKVYGIY